MSLRSKLLIAFVLSGIVLAATITAVAYVSAIEQQRKNLVRQGELLAISLNEAASASRDAEALRISIEDITRDSTNIVGISVTTFDPMIILASSFRAEDALDTVTGDMLQAVVESAGNGMFGYYLADNGDLIIIKPIWKRWESFGEQNTAYLFGGQSLREDTVETHGTRFESGQAIRLPRERYEGVIYMRFNWSAVLSEVLGVFWQSSWIAFVGLFAMLLVAFVVIQRFVLKPLSVIGVGVVEQAEGNLAYRLPDLGGDEFGALTRSFNIMLGSMAERDERLRNVVEHLPVGLALHDEQGRELLANRQYKQWFSVGLMRVREKLTEPGIRTQISEGHVASWDHVETEVDGSRRHFSTTAFPVVESQGEVGTASIDITDRKLLERRLIEAKDIAEKASAAKTQFLSNMSHELRTPLNALIGFTELLTLGVEPEEQEVFLKQMDRAGRHLLALVNDVLDLARIEAGRMSLSIDDVSLNDVLRECEDLSQPIANKYGVILRINRGSPDRVVRADYTRLKQALLNLVSNGIKYNRPQGRVDVYAEMLSNEWLRIVVEDTGAGISKDQQERLFQPFERLDVDENAIEGSGIGLVFSRKLVEAMGGLLDMSSTPGKGSKFWVDIRLSDNAQADGLAISLESADSKLGEPTPSGDGRPVRVLYVEDNTSNMKLVEHIIRKYTRYELIAAPEPRLGLELLAAHQPDLVILDINLPTMDGYEVLRKIRANPDYDAIPVLALSANALASDIQKGLKAGFVAYMAKPIRVQELLDNLERFIRKPV